jgi:uncharacterized protein (DUF779 family)
MVDDSAASLPADRSGDVPAGGRGPALVRRTDAALAAIAAVRAEEGPLMFVQSAGCCGGTVPMCYPLGEFLLGEADLLLGEVDGSPFYIDAAHYRAWGEPIMILDVGPGEPEGFSLPAGDGLTFMSRAEVLDDPREEPFDPWAGEGVDYTFDDEEDRDEGDDEEK